MGEVHIHPRAPLRLWREYDFVSRGDELHGALLRANARRCMVYDAKASQAGHLYVLSGCQRFLTISASACLT